MVKLREEPCTRAELEELIREIVEAARLRIDEDAFFEIIRHGASVIQLGEYRISIAKPPFSDGYEITIVRPLVKLKLEAYGLSSKLLERIKKKAEGILICGPPGAGKSCFASSLAEFYQQQGKIVKTLESPRDLQVGPEITQYGPLENSWIKAAEVLLLVRPDFTVFDELRKPEDFKVFAEMRLAGVGMIGVVHSSSPIDAIQRFIGKLELGMIPHVIDTIIFVEAGKLGKVYELSLTVKVPTGMSQEDLARPVVEVRDFETGKLEYEIYTYGEENVVVSVEQVKKPRALEKLALERIKQELIKYDPEVELELLTGEKVLVRVNNEIIPKLIGKEGKNIARLEKKLGISLEVEPKIPITKQEIEFEIKEVGNCVVLSFKEGFNQQVSVYMNGKFLFTATIGKKGQIKVSKASELGKELFRAYLMKKRIRCYLIK